MITKVGSKALIIYDQKVLLCLRDDKPDIPWPNTWDGIGGGIEDNETYLQTIMRELYEELSLIPSNIIDLGLEESLSQKGQKNGRFIVILTHEEYISIQLGDEGQEIKLFSLEELKEVSLVPGLKRFIYNNKKYLYQILEDDEDIVPSKFILAN